MYDSSSQDNGHWLCRHSSVWYKPKGPEEDCRHEIKQSTAPGSSAGGGKLGLSGHLLRDLEAVLQLFVLVRELQQVVRVRTSVDHQAA